MSTRVSLRTSAAVLATGSSSMLGVVTRCRKHSRQITTPSIIPRPCALCHNLWLRQRQTSLPKLFALGQYLPLVFGIGLQQRAAHRHHRKAPNCEGAETCCSVITRSLQLHALHTSMTQSFCAQDPGRSEEQLLRAQSNVCKQDAVLEGTATLRA